MARRLYVSVAPEFETDDKDDASRVQEKSIAPKMFSTVVVKSDGGFAL
tara:strand:+ start:2272 stop:2415 length:144 start_codon:yes stop_codon:yes gene_type:complete